MADTTFATRKKEKKQGNYHVYLWKTTGQPPCLPTRNNRLTATFTKKRTTVQLSHDPKKQSGSCHVYLPETTGQWAHLLTKSIEQLLWFPSRNNRAFATRTKQTAVQLSHLPNRDNTAAAMLNFHHRQQGCRHMNQRNKRASTTFTYQKQQDSGHIY